jgi:hypothetical protein
VQEVFGMNAKEFVKGKDFSTSKGFPEGKTIIDFESADFKVTDFVQDDGTTKKLNQVTCGTDTYNIPISVMKAIQTAISKGAVAMEINRSGMLKTDTKYVAYALDSTGKIIK